MGGGEGDREVRIESPLDTTTPRCAAGAVLDSMRSLRRVFPWYPRQSKAATLAVIRRGRRPRRGRRTRIPSCRLVAEWPGTFRRGDGVSAGGCRLAQTCRSCSSMGRRNDGMTQRTRNPIRPDGWFGLDNALVDQMSLIGANAFVVYAVLARHADANGVAYPSEERIAALVGFSESTVKRAIKTLEKAGLITKIRRSRGRGRGTYNEYTLVDGRGILRQAISDLLKVTSDQNAALHQVTSDPRTRPKNKTKTIEASLSLSTLIEWWNRLPDVAHCREATEKRKKDFKARSARASWVKDVPDALKRIGQSSFCRGDNDRGWRANIDWFLRPDTVTKILEGSYDDRDGAKPTDRRRDLTNDKNLRPPPHLKRSLER